MAVGAVVASIVSQYTDKGSKAARKDIAKLGKDFDNAAKKIGKAFAIASAATAAFAVKLGKDAVKAAVEDAKSQAVLANNLRNTLGATDANIASVEAYIEKQQALTNVQDTELRASFGKLAIALGNVNDAMLVQGVALDVAAGTGKDLSAVTDAITKASQGNFTALKKLVPTLDASIVKNKDLGKALVYLSSTYKGAATELAKQDPITSMSIAFDELKEKLGTALLPAFIKLTEYLKSDVIPQLELFLAMNQTRLKDALDSAVRNIMDIAHAFQNIYTVISKINDILPIGIGGWIQLAVAIKALTVVGGIFSTVLGLMTVRAKMNKDAVEKLTLSNTKFRDVLLSDASSGEKFLKVWYRIKAAFLNSAPIVFVISNFNKLKLAILGAAPTKFILAQLAALQASLMAAAAAGNKAAAAMLRFQAALVSLIKWIPGWAKVLTVALAGVAYFWDKLFGPGKVKIDAKATAVEVSMLQASLAARAKGAQTMDDAVSAYNEKQKNTIKKTKEQIAEEKRLAALRAKQAADEKRRAKFEADYNKINERIAKNHGVKLLSAEEEKMVQINAAEALLKRQKENDALNAKRLKDLKDELLSMKVRNDLASRYVDILRVIADEKITDKEIKALAIGWNMPVEAVRAYLEQFQAVSDGTISDDEIIKLAKAWGSTEAQAAQYLDFFYALNDGVLDDSEIQKLMSKWQMTQKEVLLYADFVGIVNDGKLTDAEIVKIQDKWKLTTDQVVDYIKKIGSPVTYSGTLIDPARAAEIGWLNAAAALQRYLDLLKAGTGAIISGGNNGGVTGNGNDPAVIAAAVAAANAASAAAADAAAVAAEAEAAAAEAAAEAADASGTFLNAIREATTNEAINTAVQVAQIVGESASDIANAMMVGLLGQGVDAASAASSARYTGQAIAAMQAAEAKAKADAEAAARALSSGQVKARDMALFGDSPTASIDYDEKFRFGAFGSSSTVNTAKGVSGGNLMAAPVINVTVQGSVTAEDDLVQVIRQGLLFGQGNGDSITLQAI